MDLSRYLLLSPSAPAVGSDATCKNTQNRKQSILVFFFFFRSVPASLLPLDFLLFLSIFCSSLLLGPTPPFLIAVRMVKDGRRNRRGWWHDQGAASDWVSIASLLVVVVGEVCREGTLEAAVHGG